MTAYAREHKYDASKIANSIKYAERIPPDFSAVLMQDYMCIEADYKQFLMKIPEFVKWLQTKGRLLNGAL